MAADPASVLASIDAAILTLLSGGQITEWREGSIMVRKSDPATLLKTLQDMRTYYAAAAAPNRQAGVCFNRGSARQGGAQTLGGDNTGA